MPSPTDMLDGTHSNGAALFAKWIGIRHGSFALLPTSQPLFYNQHSSIDDILLWQALRKFMFVHLFVYFLTMCDSLLLFPLLFFSQIHSFSIMDLFRACFAAGCSLALRIGFCCCFSFFPQMSLLLSAVGAISHLACWLLTVAPFAWLFLCLLANEADRSIVSVLVCSFRSLADEFLASLASWLREISFLGVAARVRFVCSSADGFLRCLLVARSFRSVRLEMRYSVLADGVPWILMFADGFIVSEFSFGCVTSRSFRFVRCYILLFCLQWCSLVWQFLLWMDTSTCALLRASGERLYLACLVSFCSKTSNFLLLLSFVLGAPFACFD